MKKIKYVKACPFLRDLSDSYLCVNDDNVVEVIIDPLIDIEWSENLQPVATDIEDVETCLFTLEVKDNNHLFCISRQMYISMDKKIISWDDIRDSYFLMELNNEANQKSSIDFCSTCLYKVLLASSPAFQSKLSLEQKIKLGSSYIINRANEIIYALYSLSSNYSGKEELIQREKKERINANNNSTSFSWLLWLTNNRRFDDDFIAESINWFQKFDEWSVSISSIADIENEEQKIRIVEQAYRNAALLKEISYGMVLKMALIKEKELEIALKNTEKIFTIACVLFEDFVFVCSQFLDNVKLNS